MLILGIPLRTMWCLWFRLSLLNKFRLSQMKLLVGGIYTRLSSAAWGFSAAYSGNPVAAPIKRSLREKLWFHMLAFVLVGTSNYSTNVGAAFLCWDQKLAFSAFWHWLNTSVFPWILSGFQHFFPGWLDWILQFFSSYLGMFTRCNVLFTLQELIVKRLPWVSEKAWTLDIHKPRLGLLTH